MRMSVSAAICAMECCVLVQAPDPAAEITSITWDSREARAGCAFLAIAGERADGNLFCEQAIRSGSLLAIVTSEPSEQAISAAIECGCAIVQVADHLEAISQLAAAYRTGLDARVVGITGSNGKTTTKDMVARVVGAQFKCAATSSNQNNELGVPATVLSADPETEVLVVEMGMRGMGQIEALCEVVRPEIGLITNIGTAHEELLGSRENIARAKAELAAALTAGRGVAILCGDDPFTPLVREAAGVDDRGVTVLSFGLSEGCAVRGSNVVFSDMGRPSFDIEFPNGRTCHVDLPLMGMHNVMNALSAAAVGYVLDMPLERICNALGNVKAQSMRQEVTLTDGGVRIIDDTYNASPDSMRAALSLLQMMETPGRRIAVLGDMGELGERSIQLHHEVGEMVAASGTDVLVCIGELSRQISAGAMDAGLDPSSVVECDDVDSALEELGRIVSAGDTVLVKASRFMGLERVVKGLVD